MLSVKFPFSSGPRSLATALLICALLAGGQAAAVDYSVEVLIFENVGDPSSERFPEDPGLPDIGPTAGFPAAGLTLGDLARRLDRSPNQRLLTHQGWRQPGLGPQSAKAVTVSQTLEGAGTLFGRVIMIRRRFLHADLDLWFENSVTLEQVRMQQVRKMRSNELHYVDHPRLGVIIIARPVE